MGTQIDTPPTAQHDTNDVFFAAATNVLSKEEAAMKEREDKQKQQKALREDIYQQHFSKLIDSIAALPKKNGRYFEVTKTNSDGFSLSVTVRYKDRLRKIFTGKIRRDEIQMHIYNANEFSCRLPKQEVSTGYNGPTETLTALGNWFGIVAPDRVSELRKAMSPQSIKDLRNKKPRFQKRY